MVVLPGVVYTTGQLLDIGRLANEAHRRGVLVCVDACHSIGAVPQRFDEWDVDFAVWCNYKYLNGGPGALAGLYVNRRHLGAAPGLAGWFSSEKAKQFDMAHEPSFARTAGAYQIGTPPVLGMCALLGSLELIQRAGLAAIREKSLAQTRFVIELVNAELAGSLGDIALAHRHGCDDVLPLECLDGLCERNSVSDQLADDGVQAIVDANHFSCSTSVMNRFGRARFYYSRFEGQEEKNLFRSCS